MYTYISCWGCSCCLCWIDGSVWRWINILILNVLKQNIYSFHSSEHLCIVSTGQVHSVSFPRFTPIHWSLLNASIYDILISFSFVNVRVCTCTCSCVHALYGSWCLSQNLKFTSSAWLAGQQIPSIFLSLPPSCWDYRCVILCPTLNGWWGPNLGLHAWTLSTVPTEPYPQPWSFIV